MTSLPRKSLVLTGLAVVLALWFGGTEAFTWHWYASHESKLRKNPVPTSGEDVRERLLDYLGEHAQIQEREIGDAAMEILKCSYGKTIFWTRLEGAAAVTILKWNDKSIVGGVETMHNPGNCLRSAGWAIDGREDLGFQTYCGVTAEVTRWDVSRPEMHMQAYSAVFRRFSEKVADKPSRSLWNPRRLDAVLEGRRDAPSLIILAYLPKVGDPSSVDARLHEILRGLFCQTAS